MHMGKKGTIPGNRPFFLTSNKILSVCKIFYHLFSCVTSFFFLDGNKITYTEYVDTFLFVFYLNTLVCKQKTNVILHGHCCFCTLFTYLIYKSSIVRAVNKYYSKQISEVTRPNYDLQQFFVSYLLISTLQLIKPSTISRRNVNRLKRATRDSKKSE